MEDDDVTVRVAVRIRPQIPREIIDMCQVCTTVTPGEPQVMLGKDKVFTYDYVFDTEDPQEVVYNTCVETLIDSSLEGYNATILAYGQTGSGKTYTMGSGFDVDVAQEQIGIIPRAIEHLFIGIQARIENAQATGRIPPEFKVMAQFMELYNEEVIDLFNPTYNKEKSYKIHEDSCGGIQVKGVTLRTVTSTKEALRCLREGALSRTTASTQMNTQSSRSHAIFTLHIKQQRLVPSDEDGGETNEFETLTAKFHFVDLAGSERLKRTGATGDRAKEGISINCGLLALGNVISALGDKSKKASHIPYRDSKLTRLLQDSLGGNSQTVMIACVSPSDNDFMETWNTLKYANRARNIKNKLTINQDKSSRTIGQLRTQIAQLQLELIEYKQGKRIVSGDGTETVNDMFYENNMLQVEVNNLRTRVKAMQDTIDALTQKNTNLLAEKAVGNWIGAGTDNHVTDMVQAYIKEIEQLQAKLIEANNTCEQLRKQITRNNAMQHGTSAAAIMNSLSSQMDLSSDEIPSLIEEAKRELQRDRAHLERTRRNSEMDQEMSGGDSSEYDSDSEEKESQLDLKDELYSLTNDIDMKQKLIDELELSQRRMLTMRQHYEDKLMQLQARIKNTQEERDKVLHSYAGNPEQPTDKMKRAKDEYTKKLSDMQKEMKRLQAAQKEHARLIRNQSNQDNQLKSYKNELSDMKRTKVKLMNKMKDESARHKESETRRLREIAQLRKETRKNANVIKAMETEKRIKDQVLKRKQEEVSNLRKSQRSRLSVKASGRINNKQFTEKHAKQKWLKVEKSINNITISKRGIVQQEVRMEHFLEKRESLGKELDLLQERRRQTGVRGGNETSQLDNYIDDIQENINYVQDAINETQRNVIEIEETQDNNETSDIKQIVDSVFDIDEAKYLLQKLFSMTLSQSHAVAQRDAKLKESDSILAQLQHENMVKAQLLDHVLQLEQSIFTKDLVTSVSSNANDTSSTYSSRSGSPIDSQYAQLPTINHRLLPSPITSNASVIFRSNSMEVLNNNNNNNKSSKIRRRTAKPDELLFGPTTNSAATE